MNISKRIQHKRKAVTGAAFVLFLFVFMIVTALTIEYYHIYTLKEHIDTEMARACNIATDIAMIDEYRQAHISKMDSSVANTEFERYLHEDMRLNSANQFMDKGRVLYTLVISKQIPTETPACYEVQGVIRTKPVLLSKLVPINIEIPFKERSRNQRFE